MSISLPDTPVRLRRWAATELDAAVGNALDNVIAHAGPGAHAFVLVEDLGDSVLVSVRDDGVGIAAGRVEEAARQGRLGISQSIVGRLTSLGGTADGVAAAQRRAGVVRPDVVVMDMQLPDGDGAQATAAVLAVSPSSRVLVLSASDERDDVLQAVKASAAGYLVKSASKAELAQAVTDTAAGRAVFTPSLAGLVLGEYRRIAQGKDDGPTRPGSPTARRRCCGMSQKGCPPSRSPRSSP